MAWPVASGDSKKQAVFAHKVFQDLPSFCDALSGIDFTKKNYYFCVSTLEQPSIQDGDKKRVRVQKNMLLSRCLILDIDFKDGNYSDADSALVDVNALAVKLNIPNPIAVHSGNGVHVYWPFAEGIPSKDWTTLAKQFKSAATLFYPALVADGSRVSDSASVLRIPDSYNLKYGDPRPVQIIQWSDEVTDVGKLKFALGMATGKMVPVTGTKPVSLSIQTEQSPPAELGAVAKNCNWVRDYIKHRAEASEPEWYAMLGLVPYLEHTTAKGVLSGDKIAQVLSQGHPGYDPEVVTDKFNQVSSNQSGPTTCDRFRGIDAKRCEGCPFASTVKTPVATARLAKPATEVKVVETKVIDEIGNVEVKTVTVPMYPKPYFRGEDGGVFIRVKEKQEDNTWEEKIEMVYDYDIYPVKRYRTELTENEIMELHLWLPKDGLRTFKLPTELLAEQKKLAAFLAQKGAVPENGKGPRLAKYLVDFVRYLQTMGAAEVEFSRFGWRDLTSANPKFVVGNGYFDKTGELHPASYAHFLKDPARAAATAGNLENWKQAFSIYKDIPNSEPFILAAMMGFAAPLMAFTEYAGVLYNMVGETSAGKSTGLKFMTSVWGQPNPTHVVVSDNVIPVFNFIGYLNAVPVAMDELTNMQPERLSDFTLAFTGGRGKMRANRDGTNQVNNIEWDTIVVGTSNTSLYDKLASNRKGYSAEAVRIYEVNLPDTHDIRFQDPMNRAVALLNANYGHAGREFIKYVIQNIPTIQKLVDEAIRAITVRGNLRSEERFWGAMFACVYVGGLISGKKLGLHSYDMGKLLDWGLSRSESVREGIRSSSTDPISILSDFLNNNLDSIIKFKDNKPHLGADGRALSNLRALKVRMELDANDMPSIAWISRPALGEYCSLKRVDPAWLRKELMQMGVLTQENVAKRLASGTGLASNSSIKCWGIDMAHPKMIEVASDVVLQTELKEAEPINYEEQDDE